LDSNSQEEEDGGMTNPSHGDQRERKEGQTKKGDFDKNPKPLRVLILIAKTGRERRSDLDDRGRKELFSSAEHGRKKNFMGGGEDSASKTFERGQL